jgi:hypothetical protein
MHWATIRKGNYMMEKVKKYPKRFGEWLGKRAKEIWTSLQTNHLWQRILKNTLAITIAIIISILPAIVRVYGKAAYLAPITTVFGHPGRRFGMMAEALVLAIAGTLVGLGWSMLGIYLSCLVYIQDASAAYTIKGVFLAISVLCHGFLRSHTPRLFLFVLLLVIVTVVSLTSPATAVSKASATQILYPILTASGVLLLINVSVFPEFSARFLGITTIDTLGETVGAMRDAGKYFIHSVEGLGVAEESNPHNTPEDQTVPETAAEGPKEKSTKKVKPSPVQIFRHLFKLPIAESSRVNEKKSHKTVKLENLTGLKAKLRSKLASCNAAQQECNFELAWAVLPPRDLKPISATAMKDLVANVIALIGNCESKYALMGDRDDAKEDDGKDEHHLNQAGEAGTAEVRGDAARPSTGVESSHDESEGKSDTDRERERKKRTRRKNKSKTELEIDRENLELVKPRREIEYSDVKLLKYLVSRIAKPLEDLQEKIDRSVDAVTSCLAYCYDVPKLPSGARRPAGIELEEIDIRIDILKSALTDFDRDSASALERATALHDFEHPQIDIMPRMETFLISSFLLNLRQAALRTLEMLKHSRVIVEKYQARNGRSRIYAPRISWRKWLISGGEEDILALPEAGRKDARSGKKDNDAPDNDSSEATKKSLLKKNDIESASPEEPQSPQAATNANPEALKKVDKPQNRSLIHTLRNGFADTIEYLSTSEDFYYAVKLTIGVFLVTWPAFVHSWNTWYSLNRGLWAALQLVLIAEVAIGTSIKTFALRAAGTTIGCLWGYAAYSARDGDRIVAVVMLVIGVIPSVYVQLNTRYVKAGMVSIISMSIVLLSTEDQTVPGTATENFLKRFIAFLIGGVVAVLVEVIIFPVRARDRLVESLAASIRQISKMEGCLAYGIETGANVDVQSAALSARFHRAKGKAEGALAAAETFLPFCTNEPRLKGSFKGMALIYAEILYVLHSIVDKMENMLHLRHEYGSSVLEELNAQVYPYRRNVAGAITLNLFAVREALITKVPLPQFFPSARLAHLRMVNRVRDVLNVTLPSHIQSTHERGRSEIEMTMVKRVVQQKFLSWSAVSAGQIEVIEYLEELIDLVKLLVGVSEFRSGLLTRPTYREYVNRIARGAMKMAEKEGEPRPLIPDVLMTFEQDELRDTVPEPAKHTRMLGFSRRRSTFSQTQERLEKSRTYSTGVENSEGENQAEGELPMSLQRVRSKRLEEMNLRLQKK